MKVQENEKLKEDYRPKISLGIDVVSDVIRLEHQERREHICRLFRSRLYLINGKSGERMEEIVIFVYS